MDAGIYEFLETRYYTHGFGLIFVLPFAIWLGVSLLFTLKGILIDRVFKWRGLALSAFFTIAVFVAVFWDVYQIGQQATRLCKEQGGLHVYKTVEAEGLLGLADIEYWSKYGFKYVEYKLRSGEGFRYVMADGMENRIRIDEFVSKYELVTERNKINTRIVIHKYSISNRENRETLSTSAILGIDGGWADMLFYNLTGFSYRPWICGVKINGRNLVPGDLVRSTINVNK